MTVSDAKHQGRRRRTSSRGKGELDVRCGFGFCLKAFELRRPAILWALKPTLNSRGRQGATTTVCSGNKRKCQERLERPDQKHD